MFCSWRSDSLIVRFTEGPPFAAGIGRVLISISCGVPFGEVVLNRGVRFEAGNFSDGIVARLSEGSGRAVLALEFLLPRRRGVGRHGGDEVAIVFADGVDGRFDFFSCVHGR